MSFIDEPILRALGKRGIKIRKQAYRFTVGVLCACLSIGMTLSALTTLNPWVMLGALVFLFVALAKFNNYMGSSDDDAATY